MAIYQNSAEGSPGDGTAVTTGNSGGGSGNAFSTVSGTTIAFDDDSAGGRHGVWNYRVAPTGSTAVYVAWTLSSVDVVQTAFYVRWPSTPSTNVRMVAIERGAGVRAGSLSLLSAEGRKISVLDAGDNSNFQTSGALAVNTWYRIEFKVIRGPTSVTGTLEFAYYLGDSTTPIETFSSSSMFTGTSALTSIQFGKVITVADTTAWAMDSIRSWDASDVPSTLNNPWPLGSVGSLFVVGGDSLVGDTDQVGGALSESATVQGSQASETDTAFSGSPRPFVAGSKATETDTANHGLPSVVITGTKATETDSAFGGTQAIRRVGSLATETDTGRAGSPAVTVQGQKATETDSAFAGSQAIRRVGSLAIETDTGRAGAVALTTQGAKATEADTANAGSIAEPGVWRPSADVSNTGWTNEVGSSSNLWASIDEPFSANDADYVQSPVGTAASVQFATGNISAPPQAGRAIRIRYQAVGSGSGTLYVRVHDGATLVAERSWVVPAGSGWVDQDVELTSLELAEITNPDDLELELEAVPA